MFIFIYVIAFLFLIYNHRYTLQIIIYSNKSVASRLALPDTHFLLDHVRPDFLFLRVVARSLILWEDVEPSCLWIQKQIPFMVKHSYHQFGKEAERMMGLAGLATFAAMSVKGSVDVSFDNSDTAEEQNSIKDVNSGKRVKSDRQSEHVDVDRQAIRQAHTYIIAGSCFALGLRFAGTGNNKAASAITDSIRNILKLRDESDPVTLAQRPERPIVEMCLSCTSIALAMVMSGTGDLDSLRMFRLLRWRCDDQVKYGSHMAFSAAIGLLFLGGGTCTLGRSPGDIAALLMAFFPRFPVTTSDNQFHLQALRHCYALAVRRRKIEAIDISTGDRVYVPFEVRAILDNSI